MSNYQILTNNDFHNHFVNNDDDDDDDDDEELIAANGKRIAAAIHHTSSDEVFDPFYGNIKNHHPTDHRLLKHENSLLQHHFQNHFSPHEDHDHETSHNNKQRDDNHVCEDLIQYSNNKNSNNNYKNNQNINSKRNKYENNSNNSNNNNRTSTTTGKNLFRELNTSSNSLMTALDNSASAAADDCTMEVPLLQQSCNNNSNDDERRGNYNNKHSHHDFECVCLCQQKGFAFNLNNSSTQSAKLKILWAIVLCCIFMVVEFVGGYLAGSLAVMTDAAHLASDCISFVIGLVAIWLGCKPPDARMSFGYKRFEVMGAIVSILGIWILTATLVLVAIQRIYSNDYDLNANNMMTISGIGILINIIMIFILHSSVLDLPAGSIGCSHGHSHSHNQHGHQGHSHSLNHSHTSTSTSNSNSYRRYSNDSGHSHIKQGSSSLLYSDKESGLSSDAICNTDEATAIELSSAPTVPNGNLLKHQMKQDGKEKNLNLRAANIHVIGDLVQSVGVFLAAIFIKIFPKAAFLDPVCTLLFSIIVIMTTINLFKESMNLIMDSVPQGLSVDDLEMDLLNIEGVKSVHYLNVWSNAPSNSILMVHLVIDILTDSNTVLTKATQLAESAKYNIQHSTVQIERMTS